MDSIIELIATGCLPASMISLALLTDKLGTVIDEIRNSNSKYVYLKSKGLYHWFDVIFFFKTNWIKNRPRGFWLLIQGAWPIFLFSIISVYLAFSAFPKLTEETYKVALLGGQVVSGMENNSSHQAKEKESPKKTLDESSGSPTQDPQKTASPSRNPTSTEVSGQRQYDGSTFHSENHRLKFVLLLMTLFGSALLNFYRKRDAYADKWKFLNEKMSKLDKNKEEDRIEFARHLIISGMWAHRSFRTLFYSTIRAKFREKKQELPCGLITMSEEAALDLLLD